jgi:hypothetical protein
LHPQDCGLVGRYLTPAKPLEAVVDVLGDVAKRVDGLMNPARVVVDDLGDRGRRADARAVGSTVTSLEL